MNVAPCKRRWPSISPRRVVCKCGQFLPFGLNSYHLAGLEQDRNAAIRTCFLLFFEDARRPVQEFGVGAFLLRSRRVHRRELLKKCVDVCLYCGRV